MYAGVVMGTGTAMEVLNNPIHTYTQGLLNCIPVPGKVAPGSRLASIPGTVPPLIGDLKGCLFRNRCPYRTPAAEDNVPFRTLSEGRGYRCVLPVEELVGKAGAPQAVKVAG
jgi:peptide/nickel transport system ATP-binding protein